jgi:flagellar basal-body rod modification protein FlgD
MTSQPVSTLLQSPPNTRLTAKTLSQSDFMKVLLSQLQNQDPLKPQDGSEMLAQMGQINSIQSMMAMQESMAMVRTDQQVTLAQSLINKTVRVVDSNNTPTTGVVTEVELVGKEVKLKVNGNSYSLSNLASIQSTPTSPAL